MEEVVRGIVVPHQGQRVWVGMRPARRCRSRGVVRDTLSFARPLDFKARLSIPSLRPANVRQSVQNSPTEQNPERCVPPPMLIRRRHDCEVPQRLRKIMAESLQTPNDLAHLRRLVAMKGFKV